MAYRDCDVLPQAERWRKVELRVLRVEVCAVDHQIRRRRHVDDIGARIHHRGGNQSRHLRKVIKAAKTISRTKAHGTPEDIQHRKIMRSLRLISL